MYGFLENNVKTLLLMPLFINASQSDLNWQVTKTIAGTCLVQVIIILTNPPARQD